MRKDANTKLADVIAPGFDYAGFRKAIEASVLTRQEKRRAIKLFNPESKLSVFEDRLEQMRRQSPEEWLEKKRSVYKTYDSPKELESSHPVARLWEETWAKAMKEASKGARSRFHRWLDKNYYDSPFPACVSAPAFDSPGFAVKPADRQLVATPSGLNLPEDQIGDILKHEAYHALAPLFNRVAPDRWEERRNSSNTKIRNKHRKKEEEEADAFVVRLNGGMPLITFLSELESGMPAYIKAIDRQYQWEQNGKIFTCGLAREHGLRLRDKKLDKAVRVIITGKNAAITETELYNDHPPTAQRIEDIHEAMWQRNVKREPWNPLGGIAR